ncbi:hypothetical protein [Francisella tularensis]|nr:hypothetical protein [Francisella tularensis]MBD2809126.1 hypothetical protein [Francisella tularensis]
MFDTVHNDYKYLKTCPANSEVIYLCTSPRFSNQTINCFTVAERNNGG